MGEKASVASQWAPYGALVIAQLSGAGQVTLARYLMQYFVPEVFVALRATISAIVLCALAAATEWRYPEKKPTRAVLVQHWRRLLFMGVAGIALLQLLAGLGFKTAPVIILSITGQMVPIFTFLFAYFLGLEEPSIAKIIGMTLGVSGGAVMVDAGKLAGETAVDAGSSPYFGTLCYVFNAVFFSLYLVLQEPLLTVLAPLTLAFISMSIGAVTLSLLALAFVSEQTAVPLFAIPLVGASTSAVTTALSVTLMPLFVGLLSTIFLHEGFGLHDILGALLIISGAMLVIWARTREVAKRKARILDLEEVAIVGVDRGGGVKTEGVGLKAKAGLLLGLGSRAGYASLQVDSNSGEEDVADIYGLADDEEGDQASVVAATCEERESFSDSGLPRAHVERTHL
eukprot:jgi/Chlat1/5206/Chrsp33S05179